MDLTELKQNYVTVLRNKPNINSEQTINSYWSCVKIFCSRYGRIYRITKQDLMEYMAFIRNEFSDSYYNVNGASLKILYEDLLKQPQKMSWFHPVKTKRRFYDIISWDEFVSMGKKCKNSKHKLILILLYSTGIRRSEMINIRLTDIDWVNNRIFINSAKGCKNGYVQLHQTTKKYILKYLREWRPREYLFNGQNSIKYSAESVCNIISRVSNKKYSPHDFRRTYLTNLIEHENVFAAKDMARHNCLNSTLHYYHIPSDRMNKMYNPLDVAV